MQPRKLTNHYIAITYRFELENSSDKNAEFLNATIEIFKNNIILLCNHQNCDLSVNMDVMVKIYVHEHQLNLTWTTDESYSLDLSTSGSRTAGIYITGLL